MLRQLSLRLEEETPVQRAARSKGATIAVVDCRPTERGETALMVDVSSPTGEARRFLEGLVKEGLFKEVYGETEEAGASRSALWIAVVGRPSMCGIVSGSGAFCLNCAYGLLGGGEWKLLVKDSQQLGSLMSGLDDLGVRASIAGLNGVKRRDLLTTRQSEILSEAISLGYFEFPRREGITQLSRRLGVRPSTLSQVLRAAEGKVMARYAADTGADGKWRQREGDLSARVG